MNHILPRDRGQPIVDHVRWHEIGFSIHRFSVNVGHRVRPQP